MEMALQETSEADDRAGDERRSDIRASSAASHAAEFESAYGRHVFDTAPPPAFLGRALDEAEVRWIDAVVAYMAVPELQAAAAGCVDLRDGGVVARWMASETSAETARWLEEEMVRTVRELAPPSPGSLFVQAGLAGEPRRLPQDGLVVCRNGWAHAILPGVRIPAMALCAITLPSGVETRVLEALAFQRRCIEAVIPPWLP